MWRLLLEVLRVVKDAANRIHVVLHFNGLVNQESEGLLNTNDVGESEAGFSGGDGKPSDDGKQSDDKSEMRPRRSIHTPSQRSFTIVSQ